VRIPRRLRDGYRSSKIARCNYRVLVRSLLLSVLAKTSLTCGSNLVIEARFLRRNCRLPMVHFTKAWPAAGVGDVFSREIHMLVARGVDSSWKTELKLGEV
jgi:hypothetical protein